jgi:hypothetical protein
MKSAFIITAAALLPLFIHAAELTLVGGQIIKGDISRVEADGLVVMTDDGIVKVVFDSLPPELQKKYGYDPAAAAQFQARQAAAAQARAMQAAAAQGQQVARESTPSDGERRLRIERSALNVQITVKQGTRAGVRANILAQTGSAASTALGRDTRSVDDLGEGFIYGLQAAEGETKAGRIYPCGLYYYTTVAGAERSVKAYALSADEALTRGAK